MKKYKHNQRDFFYSYFRDREGNGVAIVGVVLHNDFEIINRTTIPKNIMDQIYEALRVFSFVQ